MQCVSSYAVEIKKKNIPIRQTLKIYRAAVSYLIRVYGESWEELSGIVNVKKRFNAAEHLVHGTKNMILSILVDTFISKISFPMQPGPEIGSISDA